MEYTKQAITIEEQVRLLQERGLTIDDVQEANDTLYRIIHHFSLQFGPFWFMDASLFSNQSLFDQHLRILRRDLQHSNEDYIMEHWQRYDSPDMPPSWKTLEVTTFGLLSRLYSNFADPTAKHVVARSLGIRHYLIS